MTKIVSYGMGRIGGEAAYIAAISGFADELVLYDIKKEVINAQMLDIQHAVDIPISTNPEEIKDADYCIFSAGFSRSPDIKTRADLFDKNLPIAKEAAKMLRGFSGKLVVTSNPMDVFTWYFAKCSGMNEDQVVGFGGLLDSRRFTLALHNIGIKENGLVIGEHGDHQVPLFSQLETGHIDLSLREQILKDLQGSSMPIIKGKGGTVFGPAYHIASMIESIEHGREIICSVPVNGAYGIDGCAMNLPVKVTRNSIKINESLKLDDWEMDKLINAAEFLQELCARI